MSSMFKSLILPLPAADAIDEQVWVDRLLLVCIHLDEDGFRGLERIAGLRGYRKGNAPWAAYIACCEGNNVSLSALSAETELTEQGGIIEADKEKAVKARLDFVINAITRVSAELSSRRKS